MGRCDFPRFCKCRLPKWMRPLQFVSVIILIAWLYLTFVIIGIPDILQFQNADYNWHILGYNASFLILVTSLFRCVTSTQSFLSTRQPPELDQTIEKKWNGKEQRFCRKCEIPKPDRCHHCSTCESCVLKMDHHCVYINKCIGYHNYKFFLLFLLWASITCAYEAGLIFVFSLQRHAYRAFIRDYTRLDWMPWLLSPSFQICAAFFMSMCLSAALFLFYLLHLVLASMNMTTLEFCEKRRTRPNGEPFVNYYYIGIIGNLQQIFGTWKEVGIWLLPILPSSTSTCQGLYFPVNDKFRTSSVLKKDE